MTETETRAVVVGGGIAGLVAALECAKVGISVTVVEATGRLGGTISGIELDGLTVDVGASCWSTTGGTVRALVEELGLGDRIVAPRTDQTWIAGLPKGAAAAVPAQTVLGIPANPWDESVRRLIGWRGAWRAYVDRLRPPLTIGEEHNLGKLVGSRMGALVHDRLVAPLTVGGFGLTPSEVDVVVAAPGLTSALTRTGSLAGAVADLLIDRDANRPTIESLDGGMPQLVTALESRLRLLGAEIVLGASITAVSRAGERWRIDAEQPAPESADIVIVATGRAEAARILGADAGLDRGREHGAEGITREVVTLVVDEPALDAAPRGARVYTIPGTRRASGLVHHTARWDWLAREAGAGRHVLGVAFDQPADDDPFDRARVEASALLGVPIHERAVRAVHATRFELAPPASVLGHEAATQAVRSRVRGRPGLGVVGAWLAGSGLAQVVADARAEADRVRRAALFGGSPDA